MSLLSFCQWLQNTDIGVGIRESIYAFPVIESTHVLALSLSVGTLVFLDLRLLGVAMKRQPVSEVFKQVMPFALFGFVIMFVTGILLFWCQAEKAYLSYWFRFKLIALVAAGVNAMVFQMTTYHTMAEWDKAPIPPRRARLTGLISLLLWLAIITAGRTMAYKFS
jgi:hypothetical protein